MHRPTLPAALLNLASGRAGFWAVSALCVLAVAGATVLALPSTRELDERLAALRAEAARLERPARESDTYRHRVAPVQQWQWLIEGPDGRPDPTPAVLDFLGRDLPAGIRLIAATRDGGRIALSGSAPALASVRRLMLDMEAGDLFEAPRLDRVVVAPPAGDASPDAVIAVPDRIPVAFSLTAGLRHAPSAMGTARRRQHRGPDATSNGHSAAPESRSSAGWGTAALGFLALAGLGHFVARWPRLAAAGMDLAALRRAPVAAWPIAARAAAWGEITLLCALLAWLGVVEPAREAFAAREATWLAERVSTARLAVRAQQREAWRLQAAALDADPRLPAPATPASGGLLPGLARVAAAHGVDVASLAPSSKESLGSFHAEQPVTLRLNGRLGDLAATIAELSHLPDRGLLIDAFELSLPDNDTAQLALTARVLRLLTHDGAADGDDDSRAGDEARR